MTKLDPPTGPTLHTLDLADQRQAPFFDKAEFIDEELKISVVVAEGVVAVAVARDGKPTVMHVEPIPRDPGREELEYLARFRRDQLREAWEEFIQSEERRQALGREVERFEDEAEAWRGVAYTVATTPAALQNLYEQALADIREAKGRGK